MTNSDEQRRLTPEDASHFARVALQHVTREYPNKLDHVLTSAGDVRSPRELHPIFYGSFDWHSCVHGYWLLANVLRRFPACLEASQIRLLFDTHLTTPNAAIEAGYAAAPSRAGFERPYGWAWLLMLSAELSRNTTSEGQRWFKALLPLGDMFVKRFLTFLPKATYPVRVGTHYNTAFAITLAMEYATATNSDTLATALKSAAVRWYSYDAGATAWEPSGDDFLSPTLTEAVCMRKVLPPAEFAVWFDAFLPHISSRRPTTLFEPVIVSDRSDGKIAHLDGLNLSRAWCWRKLATVWPSDDARSHIALEAAQQHLTASVPHVTGDYMGEHWLATFALLALDAGIAETAADVNDSRC